MIAWRHQPRGFLIRLLIPGSYILHGEIMTQMYEHKPNRKERAPVFHLEADDGEWFDHFHDRIERLWAGGSEYIFQKNFREPGISNGKCIPPAPPETR